KAAIQEANAGAVKFGFFSLTVILRHEDPKVLAERVKSVRAFFDNAGFVAHVETTNTVEAFLGSIPGHVWENVRRPLMHTENFADFAPKTAIWAGHERCPSPLMKMEDGKKAPPLLYAQTTGSTPFRLNLHVGDLGHSLIIGPTGAGKSTALALLAAQWQRYQNSRVISFDKGLSLFALTEACNGQHYDILGPDSSLAFAPLSKVDTDEDRLFATEWLEGLAVLQGQIITTIERSTIRQAVDALAREKGRSMTDLVQAVQDNKLKEAFRYYSLEGQVGKLLDAQQDGLELSAKFLTFELEHLLGGADSKKVTVPVLLYLFHRIEQMLDGRPTLILLDEAWVMMDNPLFLAKIREWLKVLRKKNAVVIFATQSLMDLKGSPLLPVLMESCPTKIFLPNREAGSNNLRPMYTDFGLGDRQIEVLMQSTPKQDYYLYTPEGQRRIQFGMGPVTLAFCGVSDPREIVRIKELKKQYGTGWPVAWLREKLPPHRHDWADLLERLM
ncbi:MAG: conjugal transfer protein TrbE, partial [Acidithiobacillus sp.]|nr:conjugal transfer protein TrbE [Acidithiobacillus sp.]